MKILVDTNMLIYAVKHKVDIFKELHGNELITLSNCFNELAELSRKRGKDGENARVAMIMVLAKGVKVIHSKEKNTDTAIIKYALKHKRSNNNDFAVATNDKKLIKSLKKNGIRIIRLRQRRLLIEE